MIILRHKGFIGKAEFDKDEKLFCGTVSNSDSVVTFHSRNYEHLESEFVKTIDAHIDFCKRHGVSFSPVKLEYDNIFDAIAEPHPDMCQTPSS